MKFTTKQKRGVEKITGKRWNSFSPEELKVYFDYTDRGIKDKVNDLIIAHRHHPIIVEMWKQDFKDGLLFLSDFLNEDHPQAYIDHVHEIYEAAIGANYGSERRTTEATRL